jgi:hypothetical protein
VEGRGHLRLGDRRDAERERREHPVLHLLFLRLAVFVFKTLNSQEHHAQESYIPTGFTPD